MSVREKGIHWLTALLLTERLLGNVALAGYMANETDKTSILRRPLICKFGAHKQYKEMRTPPKYCSSHGFSSTFPDNLDILGMSIRLGRRCPVLQSPKKLKLKSLPTPAPALLTPLESILTVLSFTDLSETGLTLYLPHIGRPCVLEWLKLTNPKFSLPLCLF